MDIEDIAPLRQNMVIIAMNIGATYDEAQDVVQDVFLKLAEINRKEGSLDRLEYNGAINWRYLRVSIRNQYLNVKNERRKHSSDYILPEISTTNISLLKIDVDNKLRELDKNAHHKVHPTYYHDMFYTFVRENHSYRSFHHNVGIAVSTVFREMKFIKKELQKHLRDENTKRPHQERNFRLDKDDEDTQIISNRR